MSFPKRLHDALNYSEQKVAIGVAALLHAKDYLYKAPDLSFYPKLKSLQLYNVPHKGDGWKLLIRPSAYRTVNIMDLHNIVLKRFDLAETS